MSEASAPTNKDLAMAFCEAYSQGDWPRLERLCTPDFRWRVPTSQRRQSELLRHAPVMNADPGWTRQEMLTIFQQTKERCVDGAFALTPVTITAEGDRVSVEATGYAVRAENGRVYDNRYHYLFVCRSGEIAELREYQDTLSAFDVWMAP
jgi:ketosteroid isomerase-like protein